jgi:hypothetical protein
MEEPEKEPMEAGEAVPGGWIKPFLNSHHMQVVCGEPPQHSSAEFLPGTQREIGRYRQVGHRAGTHQAQHQSQLQAKSSCVYLGNPRENHREGQNLSLMARTCLLAFLHLVCILEKSLCFPEPQFPVFKMS